MGPAPELEREGEVRPSPRINRETEEFGLGTETQELDRV